MTKEEEAELRELKAEKELEELRAWKRRNAKDVSLDLYYDPAHPPAVWSPDWERAYDRWLKSLQD